MEIMLNLWKKLLFAFSILPIRIHPWKIDRNANGGKCEITTDTGDVDIDIEIDIEIEIE